MMSQKEMTSKLWEMANKLRGTMDASEYKNYILPFMFYRYLSAHQHEYLLKSHLEEYYQINDLEELEEYISEIASALGYAIDPEYTWEALVNKISNHQIKASDFQDLFDRFDANVKRNPVSIDDFSRIFADVNLGDTRLGNDSNARAKALFDIVLMINEFEFKDETGRDILGDVYEYLIGQFAASAGKKGGEFYTPHQVSRILAKVVTHDVVIERGQQFRVYDPTMGSGSLLLTVHKELPHHEDLSQVMFCGQELNTTTYNLARMNLMMHGVNYRNMELKRADTLEEDWPIITKDNIEAPRKFDAVVANPPYSQTWSADKDKDPRFKAGLAPKSKADYAFIQHALYHLEDTGTMAIVLPHGVLFRGASEGKIRQVLIDENKLDTVIGLPSNLFYGTSIPTVILVFKGNKARQTKDVLFIDASNDFDKGKNQNILDDRHIDKIMDAYTNRKTIDKYSYVASIDEIKQNDYNLNIPRYVDTFEEEETIPLSQIVDELVDIDLKINESTNNLFSMLDKLVGTNKEDDDELKYFINKIKGVNNHE